VVTIMQRLLWIVLTLLPGFAFAGSDNIRDRVEASMVVTGWVEVAPDGSVYQYALDQQDKLPPPVVDIIRKTTAAWKFKPILVDGKPVLAKANMNLRVVASPLGNDEYNLRVRGVMFGDGTSTQQVGYIDRKPPLYPVVAIRAQTGATVYLALEVDREGHVEQAIAQQVDLRATGSEHEMKVLREVFARASLDAAKQWTFSIPQTGPKANDDHWTVRVPVNFNITNASAAAREAGYGEWSLYVPGPVQPIPWELDAHASTANADAVADGPTFLSDKRFVLLTPPSPG
jgi:hypothetical protein